MSERTWINPHIDRSRWPPGEWDGEPDKVQWKDRDTGVPCVARRGRRGNWCGYVGVAPGHPWHGIGWSDLPGYPSVHGGLTFAGGCQKGAPEETICHIPGPGEPEHLWWFGFDCAHAWDYSPDDKVYEVAHGYPFTVSADQSYRTLGYVRSQCAQLARQIKETRCDE